MTKRGLLLGATVVAIATTAATITGPRLSESVASIQDSPRELVDEVWQIIHKDYVDDQFNGLNWASIRNEYLERSYETKKEAYDSIREMLEKLGDSYTRFMDPEEFKNMQIDTSGELTGVGIQLTKEEETENLVVVAPIEDTPAFKAGILARDIIIKIDGKSTEGMEIDEAVKLIRGKPGSKVTLTIKRGEKESNYPLVRARIEIHPVRAQSAETSVGDIGYIRLNQFSAHASEEMREAINKLEDEGVKGYILDLRSNPGGLLYSSVEIARMWLDEGRIVSTVNRTGADENYRASNSSLTNKPLVVLVDGGSASASEILSGALQDNERAKLVGTKTFGKGLVQSVRGLGDGSGVAVTISKYLTPKGRDIHKEGIIPDITVELNDDQRKKLQQDRTQIGTFQDPQFAEAFEVLKQSIAPEEDGTAKAVTP